MCRTGLVLIFKGGTWSFGGALGYMQLGKAFMYEYKSYRQSDAVWFDSDWLGAGAAERSGVLQEGLCVYVCVRGTTVWFELRVAFRKLVLYLYICLLMKTAEKD